MTPAAFWLFVFGGTTMVCIPSAILAWTHWRTPDQDPGALALETEVKSLRLQRDMLVATVETLIAAMEKHEREMEALANNAAEWRKELDSLVDADHRPQSTDIPFNDLLALCHPDRHDNSEKANAMTSWLIAERRK